MYQEYLNQLQVAIAPLSSDELKDLLNNDEKLDKKVDEVLEVLKGHKDMILSINREKAEENIEKEPKIIASREKISELVEEGKTLCEAVQSKLAEIKEKSGSVSQETALALLQTAAAQSEEESEGLVQKFTDNELPVEGFLESFLSERKTMHLRKLKAEKMTELIRSQAAAHNQRSGGNPYNNLPSSFYPQQPAPYGPSRTPYPLIPMMPMMPMPPPRPY